MTLCWCLLRHCFVLPLVVCFVGAHSLGFEENDLEKRFIQDPRSPRTWVALGDRLLEQDAFAEAEAVFRHALDTSVQKDPLALERLGQVLLLVGKDSEAEPILRSALELIPSNAMTNYDLADVLQRKERFLEAEFSCRMSIRAYSRNADAWSMLGDIQNKQAKIAEAENTYKLSLALEPSAYAHAHLGIMLEERSALLEADWHYRSALRFDPHAYAVWKKLAELLQVRGLSADSKNVWISLLEETNETVQSREGLGNLAVRNGALAEAETHFRIAVDLTKGATPLGPSLLRRLGYVLVLKGETDAAVAEWTHAMTNLTRGEMSPAHFAMNLHSERRYLDMVHRDQASFDDFCSNLSHLHEGTARKLPSFLQFARVTENSTEWLLHWQSEIATTFGTSGSQASYGFTTWFGGWRQVGEHPSIQEMIASVQTPTIVIVGSALGYMCAYALAIGFKRCIGYDMLCSSMVSFAQNAAREHELSDLMQFHCANALYAEEFAQAAAVWINDAVFPLDLRRALLSRLASVLPQGAIAIFDQPPVYTTEGEAMALRWRSSFITRTSWTDTNSIHVLRKS